LLGKGKLRIRGTGAGLPSLASAPQGTMVVRLRLGARAGFCAAAPAKAPASSNDTPAKFTGSALAQLACPPLP